MGRNTGAVRFVLSETAMNISPTGAFLCEKPDEHKFDEKLAEAILKQLFRWKVDSVLDFGCGSGAYVDYFSKWQMWAVGYDGNPNTPRFSPHCYFKDLSVPIESEPADCVLSLEVGEHIPKQFEQVFLDNVANHAEKHVILSWFPRPGEGIGHVNEQTNSYIVNEMEKRGFLFMPEVAAEFRATATLWWFKESILVFQRVK